MCIRDRVTTRNERTLVINPLKWENGMYRMDLDAFREQIKGCKLFILCNPHNPGGVVWKMCIRDSISTGKGDYFIGYFIIISVKSDRKEIGKRKRLAVPSDTYIVRCV